MDYYFEKDISKLKADIMILQSDPSNNTNIQVSFILIIWS